MQSVRRLSSALLAGVLSLSLAGCIPGASTPQSADELADGPQTLRVLASSETKDLKDVGILDELEKATGVKIQLKESGTLDASSLIASGGADGKYDAAWLSSNRYFSLLPGAAQKVATQSKIMASPVVLGMRPQVAKKLGWTMEKPPSWQQVQAAAASRELTYAMTNPAASNSGFSTLVAVTTGLSGGGAALDAKRTAAVEADLKEFFGAQKLTAGSTGWLTDKFLADPEVGGLFSYESSIIALNASGKVKNPLVIIEPTDGVITADYPFSLLTSARAEKKELYDKAVAWLRSADGQKMIMERTSRRPLAAGVRPDNRFPTRPLVDMPFPSSREVVDQLVSLYLNKVRRAPSTVYVLDLSGSMSGERVKLLKQAIRSLTDTSQQNSFLSFHAREDVTILPFSGGTQPEQRFEIPETTPDTTLEEIRAYVDRLDTGGGTAMYEALRDAYGIAERRQRERPDAYVTIVLLSDGEANGDMEHKDFERFFRSGSEELQQVPTFAIEFGDASTKELNDIADLTGGRRFNGMKDLTEAFRTIRGYQ